MVLNATRDANASFAIDDLKMTPGQCKPMSDYIYTFDGLENMDINRLTPLKGGIGRLADPEFLRNATAPRQDHTTGSGGYFVFMNAKRDYNTTYRTELVIDNLDPVTIFSGFKGRCLKFAYQILGNARLRVYVDDVDASSHHYPIFETAAYVFQWILSVPQKKQNILC